jgi:hypothetical protein
MSAIGIASGQCEKQSRTVKKYFVPFLGGVIQNYNINRNALAGTSIEPQVGVTQARA